VTSGAPTLVVHGHFYQPPRENPWTEEVPVEPSAAPFHDWNERITAECYRPNGWARVVDERGRVTAIVDNYAHLSFNFGPTLLSWLETHHPDVYARVITADRRGRGAIAQAYNHMILPLANERDVRTQVRWGLRDFEVRFGRRAEGLWLPETAVNGAVLAALAEEGVEFTILAPTQIARTRPLGDGDWSEHDAAGADARRPYRWCHPAGDGRGVDLLVYDGALSRDVAFALAGVRSEDLVRQAHAAADADEIVCIATDGETFGHHHHFADRTLAFVFESAATSAGVRIATAAAAIAERPATHAAEVRESAWSCVHGVARWRDDCGCHSGGPPGWNQRWRAPLRAALDSLRDHGIEVFERRGAQVLRDPWDARDAYIDVVLGTTPLDEFARRHLVDGADEDELVTALTLLEAQRHAMLMYTSCGWFFNDLAGLETVQLLRYAARAMDLLDELSEAMDVEHFLDLLEKAESNNPDEGDGRAVWRRHVEPARVDAERVVAHLALVELLENRAPQAGLAGYDIEQHDRRQGERSGLRGCGGRVVLRHRRTRRRRILVYAALQLGGLEVYGAVRPARPDVDADLFVALADAVASDERVTTLLRIIAEGFGPREFGLESALPGAAEQIVRSAADALVERFASSYEQLYEDHRTAITALVSAGFRLPRELRVPAELALARRLESEVAASVTGADSALYERARAVVRDARRLDLQLATPHAAGAMARTLLAAVEAAVAEPAPERVGAALSMVRLVRDLGLEIDIDRAQEVVHDAMAGTGDVLAPLAEALGLAP
jgi:alpha-amylase/alpha-mannosidase (GH57 family)